MILLLKKNHTESDREKLLSAIKRMGGTASSVPSGDTFSVVLGPEKLEGPKVDFSAFEFVDQVIATKLEYPKVSKEAMLQPKRINVRGIEIGAGNCVIISGPCAVESEEQLLRIAFMVKNAGAHLLRGGAYKPRTSPYKFQGLGELGLQMLAHAREATGLPIVTEALDVRDVELVAKYSDVLQIGTRNMQNFPLLKEVGNSQMPVLLKRGMSSTIQEWLLAAEYIAERGNMNIIMCERGIRSFDTETRNLLDLSAIPVLKSKTFLPVAIDPSHATGRRDAIESMTLAAVAAGAEVVMVESHDQPEFALSDGFQALRPEQLRQLIGKVRKVATALDIHVPSNEIVEKQSSYQLNNNFI